MCFILSWNMGLKMMWRAIWLSQYFLIHWFSQNFSSWRNCFIHTSSQVSHTVALYSTSRLDWEITLHFLFFQDINIPSNENIICSSGTVVYRRLCLVIITIPKDLVISFIIMYHTFSLRAFLTYIRMWMITLQWSIKGVCINQLVTPCGIFFSGLVTVR